MRVFLATLATAGFLACSQPPPAHLIVRAGRFIDGRGGKVREYVRLEVDSGTIVRLDDDDNEPLASEPGRRVIDARDATVMPGLVSARLQLLNDPENSTPAGLHTAVKNLRELVYNGFTTVADRGAPLATALGLRRYVGTARGNGPRLLVSGPALRPATPLTAGATENPSNTDDDADTAAGTVTRLADPESARAQVRMLAQAGVDFVSLEPRQPKANDPMTGAAVHDTVCALIDEAHTQKLRTLARASARSHVDTNADADIDAEQGSTPSCKADLVVPVLHAQIPRTILGVANRDTLQRNLALAIVGELAAPGMRPLDVLTRATHDEAQLLGLGDALGQLALGFRADLVVVAGRPDERLEDLAAIRTVIIDGIVQPLAAPTWLSTVRAAIYVAWAWVAG